MHTRQVDRRHRSGSDVGLVGVEPSTGSRVRAPAVGDDRRARLHVVNEEASKTVLAGIVDDAHSTPTEAAGRQSLDGYRYQEFCAVSAARLAWRRPAEEGLINLDFTGQLVQVVPG